MAFLFKKICLYTVCNYNVCSYRNTTVCICAADLPEIEVVLIEKCFRNREFAIAK